MDFSLNINTEGGDPSPTYTCGICCEDFEEGTIKKIVLKCNPNHCFCRPCILDWYKAVAHLSSSSESGSPHSCPICRKDGGFLECLPGETGLYNVHFASYNYNYLYSSTYHNHNPIHSQNHCPFKYGSGSACYSYIHKELHINSIDKTVKVCKYHYDHFRAGQTLVHKDLGPIPSDYQKCSCFIDTENRPCRLRAVNKPGVKVTAGSNPHPYLIEHHTGKSYYMCRTHYKIYKDNQYVCVGQHQYIHKDPTRPTITNHDQYVLYYLESAVGGTGAGAEVAEVEAEGAEGAEVEADIEPVVPLQKAATDTISSLDSLMAMVESITEDSVGLYQEMMKDSILGMIHHLTKSLQAYGEELAKGEGQGQGKSSSEETLPYTREEFFIFVGALSSNSHCNVKRRDGSYCCGQGYFHCGAKCTTHKTKEKNWFHLSSLSEEKIKAIARDALSTENLPCNVVKFNGAFCTKTGHVSGGGKCFEHRDKACRKNWHLYGGKVQAYSA